MSCYVWGVIRILGPAEYHMILVEFKQGVKHQVQFPLGNFED